MTPDGNRAFLLTPIPEPATVWLVVLSVLLVAAFRVRHKAGDVME
jgi:hypothetical protein